jgi:hypothetical protein
VEWVTETYATVRRAMLCLAVVASALALPAASHAQAPNSADRIIFWSGCPEFVQLTDAELDAWKSRGVDGIACMQRHLRDMGGSQDFTGDADASLSGSQFDFQRRLRDTNIVGRMRARGMKAYLGVYLVNYWNTTTPLKDWFDDRGWSSVVLPKMGQVAAAARLLGFAGLAFDQELYPQTGGATTATWNWNYHGNTHSEAEVCAQARERGHQLMGVLTANFPGIELMAYDVELPETWEEFVQEKVNGIKNAMAPRLDADFWEGLSSVPGYGAIRWVDATFFKTPHLGTWEPALQYQYNRLFSYLSRRFSKWDYASSRLFVSPFSWIDEGPCDCAFEAARPPEYVAEQLTAFRKWGMGGEFANYAWGGLRTFDYTPYVSALRNASTPAVVDSQPPDLVINTPHRASASVALDGTATDNLAIRLVRWTNDRGGSGVARLAWDVLSGDYRSRYNWRTRWSLPAIALAPGENRIRVTVENIKGLATSQVITVAN